MSSLGQAVRWTGAILALMMLCWPAVAQERRVALVIGEAAYRSVPLLRNTLNDARGVGAALGRLGFDVDLVLDADRPALETAFRHFGQAALGADAALFYYAGHAVEANGRNWMLPVSAEIHSARDLRFEALELETVLEQLGGAARLAMVFLDSCRENPFQARIGGGGRGFQTGSGLAPLQAAVGTLIAFATAPGTVAADGAGPNSPFTGALLKRIETPGLEVRDLLAQVRRDVRQTTGGRQVTWEQSALEGNFFFRPAAAPPALAQEPAQGGLNPDTVFWDSVRNSTNAEDYRAYLVAFPTGMFAQLARNRLAGLVPEPARVKPPEPRVIPSSPVAAEHKPSPTAPSSTPVAAILPRARVRPSGAERERGNRQEIDTAARPPPAGPAEPAHTRATTVQGFANQSPPPTLAAAPGLAINPVRTPATIDRNPGTPAPADRNWTIRKFEQ